MCQSKPASRETFWKLTSNKVMYAQRVHHVLYLCNKILRDISFNYHLWWPLFFPRNFPVPSANCIRRMKPTRQNEANFSHTTGSAEVSATTCLEMQPEAQRMSTCSSCPISSSSFTCQERTHLPGNEKAQEQGQPPLEALHPRWLCFLQWCCEIIERRPGALQLCGFICISLTCSAES